MSTVHEIVPGRTGVGVLAGLIITRGGAALGALLMILGGCNDHAVAPEQPEQEVDQPTKADVPLPGRWTSLAPAPTDLMWMGAAALDGMIYIAGGYEAVSPGIVRARTEILAFQPATNSWRTAGRLLSDVSSPAVAAVGDRVYVMGGTRKAAAIAQVQILDPATGTVVDGPPMPTRRAGAAAVVLDGRIHLIGGWREGGMDDDGEPLSEHAVLDPLTGAWSSGAPLPEVSWFNGAAAVDGKIYVAAGRRLFVYDPLADAWAVASADPPGASRWGRGVAALKGKIYLVGGVEPLSQCCSPMVSRFDPPTGRWEEVARMPNPGSYRAAAVVGDALHVIGGNLLSRGESGSRINERFDPE